MSKSLDSSLRGGNATIVPKLFDHKLFKTKYNCSQPHVVHLQNLLTETLQQRLHFFSRKFLSQIQHTFLGCEVLENFIKIDPETLPFKSYSADLIMSAGPLMLTNDIPGVLKQWYATLKPGGVFMASFFGEDTLRELKDCFLRAEEKLKLSHCLRFFPTVATKDAGMLLQRAGFHLSTADRTRCILQVKNLDELLSILKAMGGNILHNRSRAQLSKEFLKAIEVEYIEHYSSKEKLNVTIDIVCMTGWAIERYAEERLQQSTPKNIGYL